MAIAAGERKCLCQSVYLVFSEREAFGLDAIFGDDVELDFVAGVDVTLGGGNEDILHQIHRLLLRQRKLRHVLHVFKADLRAQKIRKIGKKNLGTTERRIAKIRRTYIHSRNLNSRLRTWLSKST